MDLLADALMMVMGCPLPLPPADVIICTPIFLINLIDSYLPYKASFKGFPFAPISSQGSPSDISFLFPSVSLH